MKKLLNEDYKRCKKIKELYGVSWEHIVKLGIIALQDNPPLIKRIQEIENYINELKHK